MKQAKCKVLITNCVDPYRNLAAEELLLRYVQPDEVLLYLWQNENTVVIGRNQNAWRECKLEAFSAQHGKLARRLSGGGAVYHDMGNQNFTFFAHEGIYDVAKQSEVICRAVQQFGIKAERSGRNDILADGQKFSGNAFYTSGSASYHHGTILISSNMSKLGEFLTPSKQKLKAKGVESVSSRVVNLCELNPQITPERMRRALIASLQEVYGGEVELIDDGVLDPAEWRQLTAHYGGRQWTHGTLSEFNQFCSTKLSFGEIELQFTVSDGIIQKVAMYSDAMNADWVETIAAKLQGSPFCFAELRDRLSSVNIDQENTEELLDYLKPLI